MRSSQATRILEIESTGARRLGWRTPLRVVPTRGRRRSTTGGWLHPDALRPETAAATMPAAEGPDVRWEPAPYEPGPCTCEDGLCDRDHEHE